MSDDEPSNSRLSGCQSLASLKRGQKARIAAIDTSSDATGAGGTDIHLRLHEMGFDEGIAIEIIHQGPFGGDPLAVSVDGVIIALRRREARRIHVTTAAEILVSGIGPGIGPDIGSEAAE